MKAEAADTNSKANSQGAVELSGGALAALMLIVCQEYGFAPLEYLTRFLPGLGSYLSEGLLFVFDISLGAWLGAKLAGRVSKAAGLIARSF